MKKITYTEYFNQLEIFVYETFKNRTDSNNGIVLPLAKVLHQMTAQAHYLVPVAYHNNTTVANLVHLFDNATDIHLMFEMMAELYFHEIDAKTREGVQLYYLSKMLDEPKQPRKKKEIENVHGVKVGDIFYTSWGWEQTNISFFQVVSVTAKMANLKRIRQQNIESFGFYSGSATALKDDFVDGEVYKKRTYNWNGKLGITNLEYSSYDGYYWSGEALDYSSYA